MCVTINKPKDEAAGLSFILEEMFERNRNNLLHDDECLLFMFGGMTRG